MEYVIWKIRKGSERRQYLVEGGIWTYCEELAARYTLRGVESLLGKLERQWVVSEHAPKASGYFLVEGKANV